jgi:hypothetical protein
MYLYECDVYNKTIGWDTYLIEANSEKEAIANLKARLENENPYPLTSWVILTIIRKD